MKLAALSRLLPWRKRAAEGAYRPGPYQLADGWLSAKAGRYWNWWQLGFSPEYGGSGSAVVEACVSAYAQTIAMCPGDHWRKLDNGGRERVKSSALSRIIRRPNDYQSASDFLLNLTRRLYADGEAFAYAVRNERFEIAELHLMRHGRASVALDGSIFYALYGNEIAERRFSQTLSAPVPYRDVLHVRLHTPSHELKGVSPILAAQVSLALAGAAQSQQVAFYVNQARPSFVLETDEKLTLAQVLELRAGWNEQTQGENAGGTPITSWGLKVKSVTSNAKDMQLAELLKMSQEDVALAYRIPLQVLGIGGTPFASTEALMSSWKAQGLGFALEHIEQAFGNLFGLGRDEYLELDTDALLRSSFKERIEALSAGTHRLYTINEARALEGLPAVDGGDEVRVQQQDVPLSYGANLQPPSPTPAKPEPQNPDNGGPDAGSARDVVVDFRDLIAAADEIERRAAA